MINYKAYFSVMKLREELIKRRIKTALELEDELFYWLVYLDNTDSDVMYNRALDDFKASLERFVKDKIGNPVFSAEFADKAAENIYGYTWQRLKEIREDGEDPGDDKKYVTSVDRASLLAAGIALAIWAHKEYVDAYADGYTRKTWVCLMDGKERDTHGAADGQTVGIDEMFTVGNCQMLYPGDWINGTPEEIANCRCWVEYSGKGEDYDYEENEPQPNEEYQSSPDGLPMTGTPNSVVDEVDSYGDVVRRRVYGDDGRAAVDYDITDHNDPENHPMGAHKHVFDYSKSNPNTPPDYIYDDEIAANSDILTKGVNVL